MILDGEVILAFVKKGKKITECDSYTDVTSQVNCQVESIKICSFKWLKLKSLLEIEETPAPLCRSCSHDHDIFIINVIGFNPI